MYRPVSYFPFCCFMHPFALCAGADCQQWDCGGQVHAFCAEVGLRDVPQRVGHSLRGHGYAGRPQGQCRSVVAAFSFLSFLISLSVMCISCE